MARTGRPRQFDLDSAVDAAMRVFWEYGYEATTLAQLREAMGLSSASFYAAFSSKQRLFDTVVERYQCTFGTVTDDIADDELPPRVAIERILRQSASMQTDSSHPKGCLLVLSAGTYSPENERVRELLADRRGVLRRNLVACVERAVALGELPDDTEPEALASVFNSFMWGISTEARDGVSQNTLELAVQHVMRVWDTVAFTSSAG